MIYDVIIIGAGMSGLAATIRSKMFQKKVLLLEKHAVCGGLNSYYKKHNRELDVGLHALTNFCNPTLKSKSKNYLNNSSVKPLPKVLRQLRIPFESLELLEQRSSQINFFDQKCTLNFCNQLEMLVNDVQTKFPSEIDNFVALIKSIETCTDDDLYLKYISARERVSEFIKDPLLVEMIFTPVMYYGSSWENDLDWSQFVIMFRSIFLEGFCKPKNGVRTLINLLMNRLREECERSEQDEKDVLRFGHEVQLIAMEQNSYESSFGRSQNAFMDRDASALRRRADSDSDLWRVGLKNGESYLTKKIISTIGYAETALLLSKNFESKMIEDAVGPLSFVESIITWNNDVKLLIENSKLHDISIMFYNSNSNGKFLYKKPQEEAVDFRSGVICFPYHFGNVDVNDQREIMVRFSMLANYSMWNNFSKDIYLAAKEEIVSKSKKLFQKILLNENKNENIDVNLDQNIIFKDVFTPKTIYKYTGHLHGSVYGSTMKFKDGKWPDTQYHNLYLAGTDQGFLGVVGSLLSGITIANFYIADK